eukprot:7301976-Prorocentrum_lima.AAC.1
MAGWTTLQTQNPAGNAHYPWWPLQEDDNVSHRATKPPGGDREGLLVDIGAYDNQLGAGWVKRVGKHI